MPSTDELHRKIISYVNANLGGVDPPSADEAAAGTMRDTPPEPRLSEEDAENPMPVAKAPPVDTSKPIGFSPPPTPRASMAPVGDAAFGEAQSADEKSKSMGKLGQAVNAFNERPSNFADYAIGLGRGGKSAAPARNTMYDDQAANGDRAVESLMARRKSAADMATQQSAAAKAASAKDPNSDTAQIYRAALLKFAPDLADQLTTATPEQMERIAPWLEKYAEEATKQKAAKLDPKAGNDESLRALLLSPVYGAALKSKGMTPAMVAGLNGKALEDLVSQLKTDTTNEATVTAGRGSAAIAADRALGNAKNLKAWENELPKNMPPEFVDQLEGLKGSGAALDQFEGNLAKTSTFAGKTGNALGAVGASQGLLGSGAEQGATFEADRERTAIALARGLEGGMARPGNVEIIQHILPHATDSDEVKKQKVAELRAFMQSKQNAFAEAMKGGNYKPVNGGAQSAAKQKPSPGPGYVRGTVDGKPGWVNQGAGEWEPD